MKALLFVAFIILAGISSGLYGAFHDQLTYTISSEYFTRFKFGQFGIPNDYSPRLGAAIVGWNSSLLMGVILGSFIALGGLIHVERKRMIRVTCEAFGVALFVTFLVGLAGFLAGLLYYSHAEIRWYIPEDVIDRQGFIVAGTVHNFTYAGGLVGTLVALYWQVKRKLKG